MTAAAQTKHHTERKTDAPRPLDGRANYSLDELDLMDRAFCEAMLAAIGAGTERCPIGVNTTPGTRRPIQGRAP